MRTGRSVPAMRRHNLTTILGWSAAFAATALVAALVGTSLGSRITGASPGASGTETLLVALALAAAAGALAGFLRRRHAFLRGYWWVPALLFVATAALMWAVRGVHHGGDTSRYVGGADRLLSGQPLVELQQANLGYVAFVALTEVLGVGLAGIIAAQVLISALCVLALYDLGRRLGGEISGVAAASLYAANVDLARFTFAILTDSLYTSGIILSVYLTYRTMAIDRRWAVPAAATVLITASIRPSGMFITPVFGTCLAFVMLRDRNLLWKGVATAAVLIGSVWLVAAPARSVVDNNHPAQWLIEGSVVWGHDASRMDMPPAPGVDDSLSALRYCGEWPRACASLFLERVRVEHVHTRPFYSFSHNLLILLVLPPLYGLAAVGLWAARDQPVTALSLTLIVVHAAVVGLTTADWDGRYLLYTLPLITLYSGVGIAAIARRFGALPAMTSRTPPLAGA